MLSPMVYIEVATVVHKVFLTIQCKFANPDCSGSSALTFPEQQVNFIAQTV